jgi:aryl-alcohol dehydrogenase-like predicted oxidoreductase
VLAQGEHVHALPGTRSIPHFDQNHAAAGLHIDAEVLEKAGALMNQQTIAGHRYPDTIKPTIDTEDYV